MSLYWHEWQWWTSLLVKTVPEDASSQGFLRIADRAMHAFIIAWMARYGLPQGQQEAKLVLMILKVFFEGSGATSQLYAGQLSCHSRLPY